MTIELSNERAICDLDKTSFNGVCEVGLGWGTKPDWSRFEIDWRRNRSRKSFPKFLAMKWSRKMGSYLEEYVGSR